MTILVLGATGMTGRSVVEQLIDREHKVRIIVRSTGNIASRITDSPNVEIIEAAVLDLDEARLGELLENCTAVISCLGHNVSFRGMFGKPRDLCTQAVSRICSILQNQKADPIRFILMSSVGVTSIHDPLKRSWFDRGLLFLLRHLLPPHRDNETAAQFLADNINPGNQLIQWCCVRPDSLINEDISAYEISPYPVTTITSGRTTARKNVARFMVELIDNSKLWDKWKYQMPVIMNAPE